jgi:antitoxin HicB
MSKAKMSKLNPHLGGTFEDFLRKDGIYEAVQTTAMKRVLAMQLVEAMKTKRSSRNEHNEE